MIKNRFPFSGSRNLVLNSSDVNDILTMMVFNKINAITTSAFFIYVHDIRNCVHMNTYIGLLGKKNKTINNS